MKKCKFRCKRRDELEGYLAEHGTESANVLWHDGSRSTVCD